MTHSSTAFRRGWIHMQSTSLFSWLLWLVTKNVFKSGRKKRSLFIFEWKEADYRLTYLCNILIKDTLSEGFKWWGPFQAIYLIWIKLSQRESGGSLSYYALEENYIEYFNSLWPRHQSLKTLNSDYIQSPMKLFS